MTLGVGGGQDSRREEAKGQRGRLLEGTLM